VQSVNPTPGEYRIRVLTYSKATGRPYRKWHMIQGTMICGGVFGLADEPLEGLTLTHIGTGMSAGHYPSRQKAYAAAQRLLGLDLPWSATSIKEWKAKQSSAPSDEAIKIIDCYGHR
jgi:hypothetical protein